MSERSSKISTGVAVLLGLTMLGLSAHWLTRPAVTSHPAFQAGEAESNLTAEEFHHRLDTMMTRYATGRHIDEGDVAHPPPGDVYVLARRWEFHPALELTPGQTYRIHLMSEDIVHSAVIGGREVVLLPNQPQTLELVAPQSGAVAFQCGEYCGLSHSRMIGSITVAPQP